MARWEILPLPTRGTLVWPCCNNRRCQKPPPSATPGCSACREEEGEFRCDFILLPYVICSLCCCIGAVIKCVIPEDTGQELWVWISGNLSVSYIKSLQRKANDFGPCQLMEISAVSTDQMLRIGSHVTAILIAPSQSFWSDLLEFVLVLHMIRASPIHGDLHIHNYTFVFTVNWWGFLLWGCHNVSQPGHRVMANISKEAVCDT